MPSNARMADPILQDVPSLAALNAIIAASAPLVPGATRAVLGEGPEGAAIAFIGKAIPSSDRRAACSTEPWARPA